MDDFGESVPKKNKNRKMVLQERMRNTKITKGEGVVPYLTRLTQIRDELLALRLMMRS